MKLNELKQGMVCKLRNGESSTILGGGRNFHYHYHYKDMGDLIDVYDEDLTHKGNKCFDIMEVSFGDKVVFKRNESRWFVPRYAEIYYFLDSYGDAVSNRNDQDEMDKNVFNTVKVFKTREEAEKRLRQQQATLSVERWIAENDVEVDIYDTDITKYYITYDIEDKEFEVDYYNLYIKAPKQFTLSSEEKAEQLIDEREKELKIMLGVEE